MKKTERASQEKPTSAIGQEEDRLLWIPEVADRLDLSEARVYDLVRQGILPSVRIGRQVRVDSKKLEDWIDRGGQGLGKESGKEEG